MSDAELRLFLSGLPVMAGMSGLEVDAVASFLQLRSFKKGSVVFKEGDSGKELYIVRSGLVASYVTQSDGTKREIYEFVPGVLFGEMAIIENEPRSATCWAKLDTELLVMDGIDFFRLVWDYPVIGVKLLSAMARVMVAWLDEASGFLGGLVRWGETARRRAVTDDLTGLFNRRFLEETMRTRFARGAGTSKLCSLLMLDIDRFREINAAYGAKAGDAVITTVAAAFARILGEDVVGSRLSGDEFAVFLPNAGIERAVALGEEMRVAAQNLFLEFRSGPGATPAPVTVTVSIGAAASPDHASNPEELFAAADKALYRAKEGGRNRVERL